MTTPSQDISSNFKLSKSAKATLIGLSFFLVAFGQPAWLSANGLIASCIGFALFWRVVLAYTSKVNNFWLGFGWFFSVQLVQMSWFLSHPFWYIYSVYFFIAIWLGLQFAITTLFIRREIFVKTSIFSAIVDFLMIAAVWTIFEWSRLYLLSGLSWNPVGLAYTSSLYALQMASLFGVYGLSFWVIFVNLSALYLWTQIRILNKATSSLRNKSNALKALFLAMIAAMLPFSYGFIQINYQEHLMRNSAKETKNFSALLVQTAFPTEEGHFPDHHSLIAHVTEEWRTILQIIKPYTKIKTDLIVLPEFVVPFGTYSFVYPLNVVLASFEEQFGEGSLKKLPSPDYPFAVWEKTANGTKPLVNNAYWIQAIANVFESDVLAGLEDAEQMPSGKIEYYSSAQFVHSQKNLEKPINFHRYAKRVLVPMGEYIPFTFCQKLAEQYGVFGSFTCGTAAEVMNSNNVLLSPSICYEETYGDIIREGRKNGADLLVNLTSDVWYPNSKLPRQHLDHARLRTVENGVPLLRACNTGITSAIDSFGRTIAVLGGDRPEDYEWKQDALHVDVPLLTFNTIYTQFGDKLIIGICLLILIFYLILRLSKK